MRNIALSLLLLLLPASTAPCICAGAPHRPTLRCWPGHTVVKYNEPVYLHVALENPTYDSLWAYVLLTPVPGGPGEPLRPLKMRCVDLKTHRQVRYIGIPGRLAVFKEDPVEVPEGCFIGATVNLALSCRLPPGIYALRLWYDTTQIHRAVPISRRAWHGVTNSTTVTISVVR